MKELWEDTLDGLGRGYGCFCDYGWQGIDCSVAVCSPGCGPSGMCVAQPEGGPPICQCEAPLLPPTCQEHVCAGNCSDHGRCVQDNRCECQLGFAGDTCQEELCPNRCLPHGRCNDFSMVPALYDPQLPVGCVCSPSWTGPDCLSELLCGPACLEHGTCVHGENIEECKCDPGWAGRDCSQSLCRSDCGHHLGHGQCEGDALGSPVCRCKLPYAGPNCADVLCSDDACSGHGACMNYQCHCEFGWQGPRCEDAVCQPSCIFGTCVNNTCHCHPHYWGDSCQFYACPLDCSGHGVCDHTTGGCTCDDGWAGSSCDSFSEWLCRAHCETKCSFYHHKGRVPILNAKTGSRSFLTKRECVDICTAADCSVVFHLGVLPTSYVSQAQIEANLASELRTSQAPDKAPVDDAFDHRNVLTKWLS